MEKTAGKRGRSATGSSSTMMRIPYALKPAIEELVAPSEGQRAGTDSDGNPLYT